MVLKGFLMFCCFALRCLLDSILAPKIVDFDAQNLSKINKKSVQKGDGKQHANWDRFWMALVSIFCPNWAELGPTSPQLGPNLAATWPNWASTCPNLAPTWPNLAPTWPNLAPTWPQRGPTWTKLQFKLHLEGITPKGRHKQRPGGRRNDAFP